MIYSGNTFAIIKNLDFLEIVLKSKKAIQMKVLKNIKESPS